MILKTIIAFVIGLVFIVGSVIEGVKKVTVFNGLSLRQKTEAFLWLGAGILTLIFGGFMMIILATEGFESNQ